MCDLNSDVNVCFLLNYIFPFLSLFYLKSVGRTTPLFFKFSPFEIIFLSELNLNDKSGLHE